MDQYSHDPFSALASDDPARNRHEARDSLFLMADFRIDGDDKVHNVRVRNLSAGGLMAEFAKPLALGTAVEFDVRGVGSVPGKVAWCAAGRVGIAFDEQIDPMLARKPVGNGPSTPYYVKPILTRR